MNFISNICTISTKLIRNDSVAALNNRKWFIVSTTGTLKKMASEIKAETSSMGSASTKGRNRLADEKSPYLLQHASNPVDWYPWGTEAFEKARSENKLIFLSVGYSTCHWCHVMERESFENDAIAKIMNKNYVNIKVDREERPDVDKIYMNFVQSTTGSGGWPMSVWLTPELKPFYGGTYFPPDEGHYGQPGFPHMLKLLSDQWKENKDKCRNSGLRIIDILKEHSEIGTSKVAKVPGEQVVSKCLEQLTKNYEPMFGGFSQAPKFPQPANFDFLFHFYAIHPTSDEGKKALNMCVHTLRKMANGGIHDHVSQGFARYSTDEKWHVPHFEKMLYDQGQLAVAYTNAYLATKDEFFADIVRDILTYVSRDLSNPSGGFYSAEDADSYPTAESKQKKEGSFCVWTLEEVKKHLKGFVNDGLTIVDVFCHHFDVRPTGNVNPSQDPHDELRNQNVLIIRGKLEDTAKKFQLDMATLVATLKSACDILYKVRLQRPRPHLDDKMITAWNGLMISGYSRAGQALDDETYVQRAIEAANFIKTNLYHDGILLRSCYKGEDNTLVQIPTPIKAFVDDYAYVIRGLLDLYEASLDSGWLEWANELQEKQDKLFWDKEGAGYFTSMEEDESIVMRLKEDQDGAEPSANSVSTVNLLRLSTFLDRDSYRDKAVKILSAFNERLTKVPISLPEMVCGLMLFQQTTKQIIIAGKLGNPETDALLKEVRSRLLPAKVLIFADDNRDSILYKNSETLKELKRPEAGQATAYVCQRHTCSLPCSTPQALGKLLDGQS